MNTNKIHNKSGEMLIYLILLLLPTYLIKFEFYNIPLNLLDVIISGSFLIFYIEDYKKITLGKWKYSMLAFVLIAIIAVFVSNNQIAALGLFKSYIIEPILVSIMVLTIKPSLYKILYALSGTVAFVILIGLFQALTGYGIPAPWNILGNDFRITSIYEYPNAVGLLLAPIITMIAAWSIHIKQHRRTFLELLPFAFIVLLLAKADGAIIAVLGGVLFSLLFTKWKWLMLSLAGIVLVIGLAWTPSREVITFQDTSGEVRLALWQGTINLIQDNPIVGAGLSGFPKLYAKYKLDRHVELLLYPHNIFLNFWVELGLAGLIWLITMLVEFFKRLWKIESKQKIVLMAGMITILIYGLVDVPYFKNDLSVIFWTILSLSTVISKK